MIYLFWLSYKFVKLIDFYDLFKKYVIVKISLQVTPYAIKQCLIELSSSF